jgi:tRNA A37 methylthiotransferase MiaB
VDDDVKEERLRRINERQKAHALERSQRYLGRVEEV